MTDKEAKYDGVDEFGNPNYLASEDKGDIVLNTLKPGEILTDQGTIVEENYDYGNITDHDKRVVKEIIKLLEERANVPCRMFAKELAVKFDISKIPEMKYEDSKWYELTKDFRLGEAVQGFRQDTRDGEQIRIPHMGFSADLEELEKLAEHLTKK